MSKGRALEPLRIGAVVGIKLKEIKLDQETWLCRTHLIDVLVKILTSFFYHIRPNHIICDFLNLFRPIWIN